MKVKKLWNLLKEDNKEFNTVKSAKYCDLYDGGKNFIPFEKIDNFFKKYLKYYYLFIINLLKNLLRFNVYIYYH